MRFYKGIDPFKLTPNQWEGYVKKIRTIILAESGKTDHHAIVESMEEENG